MPNRTKIFYILLLAVVFLGNLALAETKIVVNCQAVDKGNHIFVVQDERSLKASVLDWDDYLVAYYEVNLVKLSATNGKEQWAYQHSESAGEFFSLAEPRGNSSYHTLKAKTNVGPDNYSIDRSDITCRLFEKN